MDGERAVDAASHAADWPNGVSGAGGRVAMLMAILLAVLLVAGTVWFHYRVLRAVSALVPALPFGLEARILFIIIAAFAAHVVEALAYAGAYALADALGLGTLTGPVDGGAMGYLYYSLVSYTSLGLGDVSPTGHLRLLTGVEALNGLLLIAWSGSYTYLAMGRLWPWRPCD